MSVQTSLDSPIPEETIRVARAAFPKGNVCMHMRDARLFAMFEASPSH